jgi:hypothetical protein
MVRFQIRAKVRREPKAVRCITSAFGRSVEKPVFNSGIDPDAGAPYTEAEREFSVSDRKNRFLCTGGVNEMISRFKRASIMAALVSLAVVPSAFAENKKCQSFRVLLHANLDLTSTGVPWSGQVRGFLNGAEPLIGTLSYLSDVPGAESGQTGQAGHEINDRAKFDFGTAGTFVTEPHTAVFPLRPTVMEPFAFGSYHATAKVAPDPLVSTGRFVGATGNISIIGTFLVDLFSPQSSGIWNAEISGNLCNVQ